MITVLTWLWSQPGGRQSYTAQHVNIWRDMVVRNLSMPHRIACVTDLRDGIDPRIEIIKPPRDFEDVRIPTWGPDKPQCLRRLAMFRRDAAEIFGDRFVCMDLDCIIGGSLDPLFDRPDDFVIFNGTNHDRPYNGSMMLLRAGARPQVYEDFTPEGAAAAGQKFLGSDQAWIGHCLGWGEATWSAFDGVHFVGTGRSQYNLTSKEEPRVLFFPGTTKPWDLIENGGNTFAETNYRRDNGGRCIILGYHERIWDDLAAALRSGPYVAAILSPEAEEHWSSLRLNIPVIAVARNDAHAERIAAMHGYAERTFCGKQKEIVL